VNTGGSFATLASDQYDKQKGRIISYPITPAPTRATQISLLRERPEDDGVPVGNADRGSVPVVGIALSSVSSVQGVSRPIIK
jgi:hypothetical protein